MKQTLKTIFLLITVLIIAVAMTACGDSNKNKDNEGVKVKKATTTQVQKKNTSSGGKHSDGGKQQTDTKKDDNPTDSEPSVKASGGSNTPEDVADIGIDAVYEIVLAKVPGADRSCVVSIEREFENGVWEYEGELIYDGLKYEFEVNGTTGTIVGWEIDD